jgi:acetyl esterase/lipase
VNVRDLLDPEVAPFADALSLELTVETLASLRGPMFAGVDLSDAVERAEHLVPGDPAVPVRVHRPKGVASPLPAVVSIHGGGYVLGSYDMDDATFDRWCPTLGVIGVSVEYRLAPETPYPGPLDDCYATLAWTHEHAEELGIDPTRVGIRGVSAGGGLTAALGLLARDRGEVPVAFELLDCPMLDDRQVTPSSRLDDLAVWSRESNEFGWRCYLGDLYGADDLPATAAPGRATDLAGLPSTFVSVGAVDGFLDEDVDYAMRLVHAGVPCELHVYPGAPHGYQMATASAVARQSATDQERWLARQIAR